ncbi:MAG: DUF3047 domain-containing protein [Gemmatimonadota bacterium]
MKKRWLAALMLLLLVTPGPLSSQEPLASLESCELLLGLHRLDPVSGLPASWRIQDVRGAGSPEFEVLTGEDGPVLRVTSQSDAVFAYRLIDPSLREEGNLLRWRWRTRAPISGADLRDKSKDDSPLRLFLVFSTKPISAGRLLRDGQALFYSWGNLERVGSRFASHVSDQLAVWVLRNAVEADGEWREEVRDPFADYRAFFDAEPPPIRAIGVIPDTDQTGAETVTEVTGVCWGAPQRPDVSRLPL